MDSLHVTTTQQTGSKTSSRSASPCRPRSDHHPPHAHHTKTLSHGSGDSAKVCCGILKLTTKLFSEKVNIKPCLLN